MVSADGIKFRGEENFESETMYSEGERPIVMQVFGGDPDNIWLAAEMAKRKGFDGLDINMGCPDDNVEKQGAGACLMKNKKIAKEIISAAREGSGGCPLSVKTRIGYAEKKEMDDWIGFLAEQELSAITIHGRTRREKRKGEVDWRAIGEAGKLIRSISPETVILGNGDVKSAEEGERLARENGIDGYMVGRALIGNPWFFGLKRNNVMGHNWISASAGMTEEEIGMTNRGMGMAQGVITAEDRIKTALRHTEIFRELLLKNKSFDHLKTHYAEYLSGFDGAKEIRSAIMNAKDIEKAERILREAMV